MTYVFNTLMYFRAMFKLPRYRSASIAFLLSRTDGRVCYSDCKDSFFARTESARQYSVQPFIIF